MEKTLALRRKALDEADALELEGMLASVRKIIRRN